MYLNSLLLSSTIPDEDVPLSVFEGTWAISNLTLMIITVLESIILIFVLASAIKQNKDMQGIPASRKNFYKLELRRETTFTAVSIPIAVASIAEYFITEDICMNMVLYDRYTPVMAIFFVLETIMMFACRRRVFAMKDD